MIIKNYYKILNLVLFGIILISCPVLSKDKKDSLHIDIKTAQNDSIGNITLATIGSKIITVKEFLTSYEFGPAYPKRIKNSKEHFLDYMINEKLLAMDGYSQGIGDSAQVKEMLDALRGDLATEEMFKDDILKNIKIEKEEIDKAVAEKQITYKIRWLYSSNKKVLLDYKSILKKTNSFDSLFKSQLNDSVFSDQRSMEVDKFKLHTKNPDMAVIIDSMKAGQITKPVKGPDGWYIFILDDIWKNMITTQSGLAEESQDAEEVIKKEKMDKESDIYVDGLLKSENPVIKGDAFAVVRSYLGGYELPKDKFDEWKLGERLNEQIKKLDIKNNNYGNLKLVELKDTTLSIDDYLNWYRMRSQFIELNKNDFNKFSASIESTVWQMVRDNLLMKNAYVRGYQNKETVKQQLKWWKDKIVYAVVRDRIISSVKLNTTENKIKELSKPDQNKEQQVTK
ncbi:MAG: peptidylprolyl isomerase, partial [Ignavibacteriaceae bacterium]